MKRSLPLAQFSVLAKAPLATPRLSRQFSAPVSTGKRDPLTLHSFADEPSHQASALGTFPCALSASAAFTLIELMVVVAIIAVLAGLALGSLGYVNRKGAASRAQSEVAALASAIENYKLDIGAYPATTNLYKELTAGGPVNTKRVYFQPTPAMVNTNVTPPVFQDPYGATYQYSTNPATMRNIGFFDLYCVPPGETNNPQNWIHN